MRRLLFLLLALSLWLGGAAAAADDDWRAQDEAAARAVFERNLEAIRSRDIATYLDCYLQNEHLVRNGFGGVERGYESLAASTDATDWPTYFEATDLEVFALQPGVVYGQYRYRVRYDTEEQEGISERVFLRTPDGWRIAVTTAFGAPIGALPERPEADGESEQ